MDELIKIIQEIMPNTDFNKSKNFINDGLIDSLDIIEIITAIEEKYQININPEDIDPDNFESVNKMWHMVSGYLKK